MLLSFVLLVLFITGVIGTAIQLFGGPNINNQCNTYVSNMKVTGPSINTLAWLQQNNICKLRLAPKKNTNDNRSMNADIVWQRLLLECCFCILDNWLCVPHLDDDHGQPSEPESV